MKKSIPDQAPQQDPHAAHKLTAKDALQARTARRQMARHCPGATPDDLNHALVMLAAGRADGPRHAIDLVMFDRSFAALFSPAAIARATNTTRGLQFAYADVA